MIYYSGNNSKSRPILIINIDEENEIYSDKLYAKIGSIGDELINILTKVSEYN